MKFVGIQDIFQIYPRKDFEAYTCVIKKLASVSLEAVINFFKCCRLKLTVKIITYIHTLNGLIKFNNISWCVQ